MQIGKMEIWKNENLEKWNFEKKINDGNSEYWKLRNMEIRKSGN